MISNDKIEMGYSFVDEEANTTIAPTRCFGSSKAVLAVMVNILSTIGIVS